MLRVRTTIMITIAMLMIGAGLCPAAEPDIALPELKVEKYVLDNGLQVLLHEDHTIPMVAVNIWYHVGSRNEKPGRTGFAHLFEHMMFQGSEHHDDDYFLPLQKIGGTVNGSTNTDRTNYWENVPADYLELALYMEADRMGWLVPAITQEKLDNQRDVVKNEKRQGDNRPYAVADDLMNELLFPEGHPYRWSVIGSMDDLSAASVEDVSEFFSLYYAPNNASLCVAGDFDPAEAKAWIARYFGTIPPGRPVERLTAWQPKLDCERRAVAEDNVELPRLYMSWHSPAYYAPGDAECDLLGTILTGGKTSRLYRRLVYELRIAQDVRANQASRELGGVFGIRATAAPGHTLAELEAVIDDELARLLKDGVKKQEVALALTGYEAGFVRGLQRVGGFGGKADRLNRYNVMTGDPDYLARDLERYQQADAASVNRYARAILGFDNRAVVHVVPQGKLAADTVAVDRTTLPGSAGASVFNPPAIRTAELANGLKVYLVEKHELPMVEVRLDIDSGWSSDPAGKAGTAALTADLLDEGAAGLDAVELARRVEELGARLRTDSSFDGSSVSLNVLKNNAAAGLKLMRSVALEPTLSPADFERVRQSYAGRQKQEARQPRAQALTEFQLRCFGAGHPYAQPISGSGTPASLAALSPADLTAFHSEYYRPNNASLVMVGDLSLDEAVALARTAFGSWTPGAVVPPVVPAPAPYDGARLVVIDRPGAQQSYIVGGYPEMRRNDPDHLAMEVVNTAFGGQFASRINMNLREDKGYTYGVRSQLMSLRDGGLFMMAAAVETPATAASISELLAELAAIRADRPLVSDELADNRNRLIMGFPQEFETHGGVAGELSSLLQFGLPLDTWQTYTAAVAGVGEAAAAGVVARHLDPARVVWVIVGDWQQIEPQLRGLELGDIEVVGK